MLKYKSLLQILIGILPFLYTNISTNIFAATKTTHPISHQHNQKFVKSPDRQDMVHDAGRHSAVIINTLRSFAKYDDTFVVIVMGSWCKACKVSMPFLGALKDKLNIPIYAIVYGETRNKFMQWYGSSNLFNKIILDNRIIKLLQTDGVPDIYCIKNNVLLHQSGSPDSDARARIEDFLNN